DVHVELGAAACHPDVQREHVVMLTGEDFVADVSDQLEGAVVEASAGVVCDGGRLFQGRIGRNQLSWNQIMADVEVVERALGLGAPQLVGRDLDDTEAVRLFSHGNHWMSPSARCRGCSSECPKPHAVSLQPLWSRAFPVGSRVTWEAAFTVNCLCREVHRVPPPRHFGAGESNFNASNYERQPAAASKSGLRTPN